MNTTKEIRIMNAHGFSTQVRKLAEEQFELLESLLEYRWDDLGDTERQKAHVAEEMADCMVLMEQFRQCLGIDKAVIDEVYKFKVERELVRIEDREREHSRKAEEIANMIPKKTNIDDIIPF